MLLNNCRLVNATELEAKFEKRANSSAGTWSGPAYAYALQELKEAPTVDAVEVVHGRWHDVALRYTEVKEECSVCHGVVRAHGFRYCPHCGAKMDGERRTDERTD